jgi:large subunit ribosomal protein L21
MQYAVISTGGKQYLATPGKQLVVEYLPQEEGQTIVFDQVLLSVDGTKVEIGSPIVKGLTVSATVVKQGLGDKIRVFKYRSKSRYRRTTGHRQKETIVRIEAIGEAKSSAKKSESAAAKPKPAAKKATAAKE